MQLRRFPISRYCLVLSVGMLWGCASSTTFSGSWTNPDYSPREFKKVLVVGVGEDIDAVRIFEDTVAGDLRGKGQTVDTGHSALPENAREMPKPDLKALLEDAGFDGAVLMALKKVERETVYHPPSYTELNDGSFHTNFSARTVVKEDAYSEQRVTYVLETNVFDFSVEGGPIWNAQSRTVNPEDVRGFARDYAEALVAALEKESVLKWPSP